MSGLSGPSSDRSLIVSDVTANNSTVAKHGFLPKLSGNSGQFLNGLGAWAAGGGGGGTPEFIAGISVANFAALPDPAANSGLLAVVLASSGVWLINYHAKGLYLSNGAAWLWEAEFPAFIDGLTGTIAQFNAACTDADFATGGGTATGNNTGDQTPVTDATIATSDVTTNDFTIAKHGWVPKGTNVGNFLKDDGTWAAGGGGGLTEIWIRQAAARTLTNSTAEQQLFDSVTNGTLTIATGVYFFEALIYLTGMSATSGNAAFNILGAGTATLANILYQAIGNDSAITIANVNMSGQIAITAQSLPSIVAALTNTTLHVSLRGTFEITVAGTIIPSVTLVTAAAATVKEGTFFKLRKVGEVNAVAAGNWS